MFNKVVEIITILLEEIKARKNIFDIDFSGLIKAGYSKSDINTALAWLFSKYENIETIIREEYFISKSTRFYTPEEKSIFTPEALGYMTIIEHLGLISSIDRELIIDKLQISGYKKITVKEIKTVIASLLLNLENKSDLKSRLILDNNDTVN